MNLNIADAVQYAGTKTEDASEVTVEGRIVEVHQGSGLIQRCRECKRPLELAACSMHGRRNKDTWEYDLRMSVKLADANSACTVVAGRRIVEQVLRLSLVDVLAASKDQMDPGVAGHLLRHDLIEARVVVTGHVVQGDQGVILTASHLGKVEATPSDVLLEEIREEVAAPSAPAEVVAAAPAEPAIAASQAVAEVARTIAAAEVKEVAIVEQEAPEREPSEEFVLDDVDEPEEVEVVSVPVTVEPPMPETQEPAAPVVATETPAAEEPGGFVLPNEATLPKADWSARVKPQTLLAVQNIVGVLVDECRVHVGGPGAPALVISTVDPAHVAMVSVEVAPSGLRDVAGPGGFDFGVDLDKLGERVRPMAGKTQPLAVTKVEPLDVPCPDVSCKAALGIACWDATKPHGNVVKPHKARIAAAKEETARRKEAAKEEAAFSIQALVKPDVGAGPRLHLTKDVTTQLALLDPSAFPNPKVPRLNLPAEATVDVKEALTFLKVAKGMTDHVAVEVTKDGLRMFAEGDTDTSKWQSKLPASKPAGQRFRSMFSLDYFAKIVKACGSIADTITFQLGTDYPVRVTVEGDGVRATYLLAPRIDADDNTSYDGVEPETAPAANVAVPSVEVAA